jgi:2-keto-4-pentenoate hydratase/2-oxohepta-3-ene-1,7-dioic acid hydratase in catechol pathway
MEPLTDLRLGIVQDDKVFESDVRSTMADLLSNGQNVSSLNPKGPGMAVERVLLGPPVPRPGKVVATIVNTKGMLGGDLTLEFPRMDMKAPSTVVGPGDRIVSPSSGIRPEVELAAVIGRRISRASADEARDGIFGYTILNDVTAPKDSKDDAYQAYRRDRDTEEIRKMTMRGPLFRSKNHDGFCPMGPWMVTPDELGDRSSLKMATRFDGAPVQDGSTADYIFTPEQLASYVSSFLTLDPGDIISCGSVGWTMEALGELDPTEFVLPPRPGILELEIENIGILRNHVVLAEGS